MSLSTDTNLMMPVQPANMSGNGNGNGWGFGGDGAWWIIILFLFVFCGWGNNGWGNNGAAQGAADNYVLASDFATLQRQIDSSAQSLERKGDAINTGLCDGFYAQNSTMLTGFGNVNQNLSNGFASVNQNMSNGFANAELSRANQQAALVSQMNANNITAMQNANALQTQIAQCCCDNKAAIADVNYNMATQANGITNAVNTGFCQTNYNNQTNTRDIIEAQNAGTRAILDKLTSQELAAKDAQIQAQNQQIFGLQLQASQQAQNNYLVNTLRPSPVPSYTTCNPWGGTVYGGCTGCGAVA